MRISTMSILVLLLIILCSNGCVMIAPTNRIERESHVAASKLRGDTLPPASHDVFIVGLVPDKYKQGQKVDDFGTTWCNLFPLLPLSAVTGVQLWLPVLAVYNTVAEREAATSK